MKIPKERILVPLRNVLLLGGGAMALAGLLTRHSNLATEGFYVCLVAACLDGWPMFALGMVAVYNLLKKRVRNKSQVPPVLP